MIFKGKDPVTPAWPMWFFRRFQNKTKQNNPLPPPPPKKKKQTKNQQQQKNLTVGMKSLESKKTHCFLILVNSVFPMKL